LEEIGEEVAVGEEEKLVSVARGGEESDGGGGVDEVVDIWLLR
jgi:hypothetical protein